MDCQTSAEQLAGINISEYNKELWKRSRQPLSATFEITPRCNFRCIHCYLGKHRENPRELTTAQVMHILDELSDNGALFVTLTGGECMLRPDFPEIYMAAKRKGFMVCVFTNAYHFTPRLLDLFAQYPPFFVDISLYGASNETYRRVTGVGDGFDVVLRNLRELKRRGIQFGIKTPIFRQNLGDYEAMCAIAEALGVKYRFSFALSPTIDKETYPVTYMVSPETMIRMEAADPVYREMGERYAGVENGWGRAFDEGEFVPLYICAPGVNDMFINFEGAVMPCASFRSEARSLLDHSLAEIWVEFAKFRQIPATAGNRCMRCESRYYCRVCPADQLQYHGDAESTEPSICAHAHARCRLFRHHLPMEEVLRLMRLELGEGASPDASKTEDSGKEERT